MGLLKEMGRHNVPFTFQGKSTYLKITRYTTFNDVVHMLTSKMGIPWSSAKLYTVYECTWDLERMIGGDVRVLGIWKSWGCEMKNFRFVVKRIDTRLSLKTFEDGPIARAERDIDAVLSFKYEEENVKMNEFGICSPLDGKRSQKKHSTSGELPKTRHGSLTSSLVRFGNNGKHRHERKETTTLDEKCVPPSVDSSGKKALFAKYFRDLKMFHGRKSKKSADGLGKREKADGTEYPNVHVGRQVEGCDSSSNTSLASYTASNLKTSLANCRFHWEKHSDSDTYSDVSSDFSESVLDTDDESITSAFDASESDILAFDTAFVKLSLDSDSDEGIDVTSLKSNDLNTAFVSERDYRKSTYDSDEELDRHIHTTDFVREIFGAGSDETYSEELQDDEIDSFMRSRLDSF